MKGLSDILFGLVIIFLIVLLICGGLWLITKIDLDRYGGKDVYCVEDSGAEFNATIVDDFLDTFWYFDYDESGLHFMGTDGIIYQCRGIAKLS